MRFAAMNVVAPTNVTFLESATVPSAATRESWLGVTGSDGIFSLSSVGGVTLTNGNTYWLELRSLAPAGPTAGARNWSSGASTGVSVSFDQGATWPTFALTSPAFEVSVHSAAAVTPGPATMTRMATGLVGMVGAGIRRRKWA